MTAGTDLYYNGVTLLNVLTREFSQDPVRDDSNTDMVHHRFRVQAETILNVSLLAQANPRLGAIIPGGAATPAGAIQILHRLLSQDRGELSYTFNGVSVLHVLPCNTAPVQPNSDANNGPRVFQVGLTQISPNTIHILFGVEAALIVCNSQSVHPVINNRWSSTDDLDENFVTTRHWRGKLRLRTAARSAHDFRSIVVPPLFKGWRREKMHFTAEANALEFSYDITDREMAGQSVPSPATSMSCTHTETATVDGATLYGRLHIRLDGPRGADKNAMLQRAAQIAVAKLDIATNDKGFIQNLELIDHIGPNVNAIELSADVLRVEANPDVGALFTSDFGKTFIFTPGYDKDIARDLGPNGTASNAGLFACYLQDPCPTGTQHVLKAGGKPTVYGNPDQDGDEPRTLIAFTEAPATDQIKPVEYSAFHQQAIYTYLKIESHIERVENRVGLPIAKHNPGPSEDTVAVIRLAPATALRHVKVEAERVGKHVQLYKPLDFNAGGFEHKLKSGTINLRPPGTGGDGKKGHAGDAEYTYFLHKAPAPDEALPVPSLFWDNTAPSDNTYDQEQWLSPTGEKGLGSTATLVGG